MAVETIESETPRVPPIDWFTSAAERERHALPQPQKFALPLGPKSPVSFYAQLGVGFVFNPSVVVINTVPTSLVGNKFLFQYGAGLRFRPLVVTWGRKSKINADFEKAEDGLRISFRIELTRFRRGYIDDTFLGGSLGVTF